MFAAFAVLSATDRTNPKRFGNAAFWGLLAVSFLLGDRLGDLGNGVLVLALVALAGIGRAGARRAGDHHARRTARRGRAARQPAVPARADHPGGRARSARSLFKRSARRWSTRSRRRWSRWRCGVLLALARLLRSGSGPRPPTPLAEGRRLMDAIGWAAVLPQMLASLGAVFALAGVGDVVGGLAGHGDPRRQPVRRGARLRARHGAVHDDHGQCLRRLPGDDRGDRPAAAGPAASAATRRWSRRSACSPASAAR